MKAMKIQSAALLLTLVGSSLAFAQQPAIPRIDRVTTPTIPALASLHSSSMSAPQITPEMWLYIQEQRRHDDPAQAVRRKAEYQASQRQTRIASAKWFGYSNSRPETSPIPTMGVYSTGWVGNGLNRYEWIGAGTPYISAYGGLIR
jgi:hypothetical protein